jgi:hypothetical protein
MEKDFSDFEREGWVPYFIKRLYDVEERCRAVLFFFLSTSYYLCSSVYLFNGGVFLLKSKLMVWEGSIFF